MHWYIAANQLELPPLPVTCCPPVPSTVDSGPPSGTSFPHSKHGWKFRDQHSLEGPWFLLRRVEGYARDNFEASLFPAIQQFCWNHLATREDSACFRCQNLPISIFFEAYFRMSAAAYRADND